MTRTKVDFERDFTPKTMKSSQNPKQNRGASNSSSDDLVNYIMPIEAMSNDVMADSGAFVSCAFPQYQSVSSPHEVEHCELSAMEESGTRVCVCGCVWRGVSCAVGVQ